MIVNTENVEEKQYLCHNLVALRGLVVSAAKPHTRKTIAPVKENKLSNPEIRQWYKDELAKIPKLNQQWIEGKKSLEERAELAWKFRRDTRLQARAMMEYEDQREELRQRDQEKYGNPDGPSFELLVERAKMDGLAENDIYEAIIKGSYRTDAGIDKKLLQ